MKADVRDRALLAALRPSELAAYLRSQGWQEADTIHADSWALFTCEDAEIALPLTDRFRDYPQRVADVLRTLEIVEGRDQLQILADLSMTSTDVVRVRILDPEAQDGTLPLDRAMDVVTHTHHLMLAAACSTAEPKMFYPARKPARAIDYMKRVRMGQTERGSFVVTVLSRVPPDLISPAQAEDFGLPEPFERQVPVKLSTAIDAVTRAAGHAIATGSLDQFEAAVPRGVSSNLCTAMSGLGTADYGPRAVTIDMTWARSRRVPPPPRAATFVMPDFAPVLKEAALLLKTKAPREEFEMRGFVFRLRADPPGTHVGEVTVQAEVDGEPRNIWLDLQHADYALAARAHTERRLFSATGVLKKEGRSYRLFYPRNVRIIEVID
ncbi:hypothetical protein ACFPN2_28280 [Steroidobacter flavus]|uniref:Uncharacterized protein n=1 Tax=Steroidobacter flavus TaxID=1842136 RepID=A0ABV8T3N5_9GAMM